MQPRRQFVRLFLRRITAVGTTGGLENDLIPAARFDLELVERAPFPRRINTNMVTFPWRFLRAVRQGRKILRDTQASCVIGFGGYASSPLYRAAVKEGIPIIVHEANAVPGMANKLGAQHARVVALTFPSTPLRAKKGVTVTVGLPLRSAISELANSDDSSRLRRRQVAAQRFGLDPQRLSSSFLAVRSVLSNLTKPCKKYTLICIPGTAYHRKRKRPACT